MPIAPRSLRENDPLRVGAGVALCLAVPATLGPPFRPGRRRMLAAMPGTAARFQDDPPAPPPGTRLSGIALGIDVGGTGVKAGLVDLATAELVTDRIREKTPQPSKPEAVAATIGSVVSRVLAEHDVPADLPVGCGLPGVVRDGRLTTAANIDHEWVGWPAEEGIGAAIGRRVMIINDADAAGLAEVAYGAGEGVAGTLLLLTIGTGIGSALFIDGILVPNTEFGHIELKGKDAESRVSGAARERRGIGWKAWAARVRLLPRPPGALSPAGPDHPRRRRLQGDGEVREVPRSQRARSSPPGT